MRVGYNGRMTWDMIGHQWAVDLLRQHIMTDQVRHAYLFIGAESLGKKTLALRLAQVLNCPNLDEQGDPCGQCISCRQIQEGVFPDVRLIEPESASEEVKVDQVRELSRWLSLAPYQSRWRIAVLVDFHQANEHAANALLKTLEEPAENVLLILTARSSADLLPTIISRCEVLKLRPVPVDILSDTLQKRGMGDEETSIYARISGGFPGKAIRLLEEPETAEHRTQRLAELMQLLAADRISRLAYADALSKFHKEAALVRSEVLQVLAYWQLIWRDVLLTSYGADVAPQNPDQVDAIDQLSMQVPAEASLAVVMKIQQTSEAVQRNANIRLAMESLLLSLPHLQS